MSLITSYKELRTGLDALVAQPGAVQADKLEAFARNVDPSLREAFEDLLERVRKDSPSELNLQVVARALQAVPTPEQVAARNAKLQGNTVDKGFQVLVKTMHEGGATPQLSTSHVKALLAIEDPLLRGAFVQLLRQLGDEATWPGDPWALTVPEGTTGLRTVTRVNVPGAASAGDDGASAASGPLEQAWQALGDEQRQQADTLARAMVGQYRWLSELVQRIGTTNRTHGHVAQLKQRIAHAPPEQQELLRRLAAAFFFDVTSTADGVLIYTPRLQRERYPDIQEREWKQLYPALYDVLSVPRPPQH